jgi:hypothetical protein
LEARNLIGRRESLDHILRQRFFDEQLVRQLEPLTM